MDGSGLERDAGIDERDFQPAEPIDHLPYGSFDPVGGGNVAGYRDYLSACVL